VQSRKGRSPGWFVGARQFELPELKLLVDAVQSSKFITRRKSDALIHKLESLASTHQAKQLQRRVFVSGRVKNMNESIHRSVEFLTTAIEKGVQIRFKYFDYDVKQERVYRKKGGFYTISPYNLIYSDDNYYLLAYDPELTQFRTYRVDRMAYLGLTDKPREGQDSLAALNLENYQKQTFSM